MNERIRELLRQAEERHPKHLAVAVPEVVLRQDALDMFAELIVRECADQIISKGTDWVDFAPSQTGVRPEYRDMAQQIKQHFGIE